jgi:hypothetical protein
MAVSADRRQAPRYRLVLGVELPDARGLTRDVSEAGVFFESDGVFTAGAPLSFVLVRSRRRGRASREREPW